MTGSFPIRISTACRVLGICDDRGVAAVFPAALECAPGDTLIVNPDGTLAEHIPCPPSPEDIALAVWNGDPL